MRSRIGTLLLYILLTLCWSNPSGMNLYAQDDEKTEEKDGKKEEKKEKKSLKEILSFKNFFHHSDSSRLAKRYIRWHKKLPRNKRDYRFTIDADDVKDFPLFRPVNENELTKEVFGWYPHWEENLYKSLDYSLLSTVAYFSYEVDPRTGDSITVNNWLKTPLIDSLKKNNKKILLTVSNFGNQNNKKFLKNAAAGDTLIKRIIEMLDARKANGVCIDFEGILNSQKRNYNSFIALLSQELKKHNEDYLVYLTVPAVDWNKYLDYDLLIPAVDQFIIMGYNYYGSTSKVAGPVAPLESGKFWDPFNLTTSVDYYLENDVPPSKLILALPFYGSIWQTRTGRKGSKVRKFIGYRTIDYIKQEMDSLPEIKMQYDSISHSAWYSYVVKDSKNRRKFRQLWFDSDSTMLEKLNFIKEKDLNGMGIWALGYNKHYENYWDVIRDNLKPPIVCVYCPIVTRKGDSITITFVDSTTAGTTGGMDSDPDHADSPALDPNAKGGPTIWDKLTDINGILKKVTGYKAVLFLVLAFVVFFGGLGFIIAMFKPSTRMFFFNSKAYTIYYAIILSVFLLVMMRYIDVLTDPSIILLFGFVVGAIVIYLVSRYVQKVKRNLP